MVQCARQHEQGALIQRVRHQNADESDDRLFRADPDEHGEGAQRHDRRVCQHLLDAGATEGQVGASEHGRSAEKHQGVAPQRIPVHG